MTTRTPRSASERKKVWTPPNALETPKPPEGYKYRWVRRSLRNEDDVNNVLSRTRQHYEPVKAEELMGVPFQSIEDGKHAGTVTVGDLMLMKVPDEVAQERQDYYEGRARLMQKAVDQELDQEDVHETMRVTRERRSTYTTGRRPQFQDD